MTKLFSVRLLKPLVIAAETEEAACFLMAECIGDYPLDGPDFEAKEIEDDEAI